MTQALFLLIIFAGHFYILVPSTPGPRRQELWATAVAAHQSPKPLSLDQIEEMLKYKYEDEIISGEIRRKGIAFRVDPATLERLLKQGVSSLTKQALLRDQ